MSRHVEDSLTPGGEVWQRTMSPSKAAAALGVSRYESPYRLWCRMKGLVDPEPPKDIFTTGHAMELALAYLWREENPGWQLSPGEVRVAHDRFGFPLVVHLDRRARRGSGRKKVVEFKSARSLEEWGDHFTDQAPADYLVQVQAEMHFSGYTKEPAHLMVMGPRLQHHTYVVPYDAELGAYIENACRKFMQSLDLDNPPEIDDSEPTYLCCRDLHPDIEDRSVEVGTDLALDYHRAIHDEKAAIARARLAKSRMYDVMGTARYATANTVRVARRQPSGKTVALYPVKVSESDIRGEAAEACA